MRTEELRDGWRLSGRITGAGAADVQGDCALPFRLYDWERLCGRDGLFLRAWELLRIIARPKEPPHSHAERTLLTLDGVYGTGVLTLDGQTLCPLAPAMEVDLSEQLRQGEHLLALRFSPQLPALYPGEHGRDLPVETMLVSAHLRNVYLLRIDGAEMVGQTARIRLYAYGAGKVRVCLRLMRDEALLWSENFSLRVSVGEQTVQREAAGVMGARGALLRVTVDMGGEGCDARTVPYQQEAVTPCAVAHFRALPTREMLCAVKNAGFDSVALHGYAHEGIRAACASLGLKLLEEEPMLRLRPLLRRDAPDEPEQDGACLCAPMRSEEEGAQFAQAEKLKQAVLRARAEGRCAHVLAWGRQRDAQDGLFDAQGAPRQSLYAMKEALGRVAVWAQGARRAYLPFADFSADILLLCAVPDRQPAVVRARLMLWDGTEVASRSFALNASAPVVRAGTVTARLPWAHVGGLVLRLQCWKGGCLVAQNHAYYPCMDENGRKKPFPSADLELTDENGSYALCNGSNATAAGVTVLADGKSVLRCGALLPGERLELAQDEQIVVQYGNAMRKDGETSAPQRFLRRILPNTDAAAADSEAEHR